MVVVSGVDGTVHAVKLIQSDAEDGVAKSIQEVITQLSGQCFAHCESIAPKRQATPKPFQLRLQFELIKDIRLAGLNRQS